MRNMFYVSIFMYSYYNVTLSSPNYNIHILFIYLFICKYILSQNKQKIRVSAIEDFVVETTKEIEKNFQNVVGQDSLTRFDQKPKKKNNNKNKKRRKPTNFKNGSKKE